MCCHPVPSKPKPQQGWCLPSPNPGDFQHTTTASTQQPSAPNAAVMGLSPHGRGKERQQNAETGPPCSAPPPFLSKLCHADPHPDPRDAFWGLKMLMARLGFPVFPARAEMCQGSHTWPQSVPSPQAADTVVGIILHNILT